MKITALEENIEALRWITDQDDSLHEKFIEMYCENYEKDDSEFCRCEDPDYCEGYARCTNPYNDNRFKDLRNPSEKIQMKIVKIKPSLFRFFMEPAKSVIEYCLEQKNEYVQAYIINSENTDEKLIERMVDIWPTSISQIKNPSIEMKEKAIKMDQSIFFKYIEEYFEYDEIRKYTEMLNVSLSEKDEEFKRLLVAATEGLSDKQIIDFLRRINRLKIERIFPFTPMAMFGRPSF
jgi:hypothetical protein